MIRWLFALLTPMALAGVGLASSCRARVVVAKPAVVVKEAVVVVPAVVPVAVYAVSYGAVYAPPVAVVAPAAAASSAPTAGPSGELQQVLEALKSLDSRLRRLEGGTTSPPTVPAGPPAPPPAPGGPPKGLSLLQARCASCHEKAVAAAKGDGLVLFEGASLTRDDKILRRALGALYASRMPKTPEGKRAPLSDQEVAEIMAYLDTVK